MRILTHPVHTAWEYEFAKIGHEIFTIIPDNFVRLSSDGWGASDGTLVGGVIWNHRSRPMPSNIKPIQLSDALVGNFDVCIAHTVAWLEKLQSVPCPKILKVHVIPPVNFIPQRLEKFISAITFNNQLAMERVITKLPIFKNVIPVPIDSSLFKGYVGSVKKCFTIAHFAKTRPEKKIEILKRLIV